MPQDDDIASNQPGATEPASEPVAPQTTTPPSTQTQENDQVQEVSHAQPDQNETPQFNFTDFATIWNDNSIDRTKRIRKVFTEIHAQDATFLNDDDRFNPFRRTICKELDISATMVNRCRDQVLHITDKENNGEPEFPDKPAGAPIAPTTRTTAATTAGAGAPFGGVTGGQPAPAGQDQPPAPDEPFNWTKKKVGKVMKLFCNMPGWMLEEWIPITQEEETDMGDSFVEFFQESFSTNKKAAQLTYIMACMEAVMRPRLMAMMQYRLAHKKLEEVKERARKDIAEEQKQDGQ